ncbi:MAG TPA: hypothetical protein VH276_14565 [Solirubrobacteraceae bacterium]|nr:hypothetical protein [Solirubrobacteraceae bacterium]
MRTLLAILAALLAAAGLALLYAQRSVFDEGGFAARTDAALRSDAVREAAARRIAGAAVRAKPDLVAVQPLLESAAAAVTGTPAFRSLAVAAARDVHRAAFDRDASSVTLAVTDAGILVSEAASHLSPDLAKRLPDDFDARLASVRGGFDGAALRVTERADTVRRLWPLTLLAAALLAAAAIALSRPRRAGVIRVGAALAAVAALLALATLVVPRLAATRAPPADRDAVRAIAAVWLEPLRDWSLALGLAAAVVAIAAASVVRPVSPAPLLGRAWRAAATRPARPALRAVRGVAMVALGVAVVLWPGTAVAVVAVAAGALLVLAGAAELMALAARPPAAAAAPRARRRTVLRVGAAAVVLVLGAAGAAAIASGDGPDATPPTACNGSRALCSRPLDDVAFAGTHNSMSAAGEPGWLFAAQEAGIPAQLRDGIRALLIDTHYGVQTPRGVASVLGPGSKSRAKIANQVGDTFVRTAERLRKTLGYRGGGTPAVFLCHAFCEVGATGAVAALTQVHRFLVAHPGEVLILSIEDDTSAQATAAAIHASGLDREVYRGRVTPPWPTLGEMVERNQRVLVLVENHAGGEPWMHRQDEIAQETPYRFETAAELRAPDSCRPNRGGTRGSLLLVNHWVDTSPAPRPTLAERVNAAGFLGNRLARCERERTMLPNIVAVDFYREGDLFGQVAKLNRAAAR